MNKIALSSLLSLSVFLLNSAASAQNCPPGSFCVGGQVNLGVGAGISAGLQIGTVRPPPPPATVVMTPLAPPPQVIVVEQPSPPVYVQAPPPRVVVTSVPTYTYTTTTTVSYVGTGRSRGFGLGAFAAGLAFGSHGGEGTSGMGGGGAMVRFRHHPVFASELSLSGVVGRDYNRDSRVEVPLTVSGLVYFNPQNRFQVYGVIGVGMSWAAVAYNESNAAARRLDTANYSYFGGLAGLGFEWQLSPNFSVFTDARAFIRTRVDAEANNNPEFTRLNSSGRVETTNVSAGVAGQLGGIFYF